MKYTADEISLNSNHTGPYWKPARPVNHKYEGWLDRVRYAWGVLFGKYDALDWEDAP